MTGIEDVVIFGWVKWSPALRTQLAQLLVTTSCSDGGMYYVVRHWGNNGFGLLAIDDPDKIPSVGSTEEAGTASASSSRPSTEVLIASHPGCLHWVKDSRGYVPQGSVSAYDPNASGETAYIGCVEQGTLVGCVRGSLKGCHYYKGGRETAGFAESYEVLVVRRKQPQGRHVTNPQSSTKKKQKNPFKKLQGHFKQSQKLHPATPDSIKTKEEALIEELKNLQRRKLHWVASSDDNMPPAEALGIIIDEMESPEDVFLKTTEWIPYISRIARLHGLPLNSIPILCKFIETSDLNEGNHKSRVAAMLNFAVDREDISPHCGLISLLHFLPRSGQGVLVVDHVLQALLGHLKWVKRVRDDEMWKKVADTIASFVKSALQPALNMLPPARKCEFVLQFRAHKIKLSDGITPASASLIQKRFDEARKIETWKRKSLATPDTFQFLAPTAHTVCVQQVHVVNQIAQEATRPLYCDFAGLYATSTGTRDTAAAALSCSNAEDKSLDEMVRDTLLGSTEASHRIHKALMNPKSTATLTEEHLSLLTAAEAAQRATLEATERADGALWAIILSLAKYTSRESTSVARVPAETVELLLEVISSDSSKQATTQAACAALCAASESLEEMSSKSIASLREILKRGVEEDTARGPTMSATNLSYLLRCLTQVALCSSHEKEAGEAIQDRTDTAMADAFSAQLAQPYSMTTELSSSPSTITELIPEVLMLLQSSATTSPIRAECSRYLALLTSEHKVSLWKDALETLKRLATEDPCPEVQVFASAAFANGLRCVIDKSILQMMTEVFLTSPVELVVDGHLPEDYEYKINGIILKVWNNYPKLVPKKLLLTILRNVNRYTINCAKTKGYSKQLQAAVRGALEFLTKSLKTLTVLPGTIAALERMYLRCDEEETQLACLRFIINCLELRLQESGYQCSQPMVERLGREAIRKSDIIFPQALHVLSTVQDLSEGVFEIYHSELAALRMKISGFGITDFLKENALDGIEDDVLVAWLDRNLDDHHLRQVSARSVTVMLNALRTHSNVISPEVILKVFHKLAATYGHRFEPEQLFDLISVNSNEGVVIGLVDEIFASFVKNYSLSREIVEHYLTERSGDPTVESTRVVHAIFKHQETSRSEKHLTKFFQAARISIIRGAEANIAELYISGQKLLLDLLKLPNGISPNHTRPVYETILCRAPRELHEEPQLQQESLALDVKLFLEFLNAANWARSDSYSPLGWDEINQLIVRAGPDNLLSQPKILLQRMKDWLEKRINTIGYGNKHALVITYLLRMRLGGEEDFDMRTVVSYVDANSTDLTALRERPIIAGPKYTKNFRKAVRREEIPVKALEEKLRTIEASGGRVSKECLDLLGSALFDIWATTERRDRDACLNPLLNLISQLGWQPDQQIQTDIDMLVTTLRSPPSIAFLCSCSCPGYATTIAIGHQRCLRHAKCQCEQSLHELGSAENVENTVKSTKSTTSPEGESKELGVSNSSALPQRLEGPEELDRGATLRLVSRWRIADAHDSAVCLILVHDFCGFLRSLKLDEDWLERLAPSPPLLRNGVGAGETVRMLHNYMKYLMDCEILSTVRGLSVDMVERLHSVEPELLCFQASAYRLGLKIQQKTEHEMPLDSCLLSGIQLLRACANNVDLADRVLRSLNWRLNLDGLAKVMRALDAMCRGRGFAPICDYPYDGVEKFVKSAMYEYIRVPLKYSRKPYVVGQLLNLIRTGSNYRSVLSWKHVVLIDPALFTSEKFVAALESFFDMLLVYGIQRLDLNFFREHFVSKVLTALAEGSTLNSSFMLAPELLLSHGVEAGSRDVRTLAEKLAIEVQKDSHCSKSKIMTEEYTTLVESVRSGEVLIEGPLATEFPHPVGQWKEEMITKWAERVRKTKLEHKTFLAVAWRAVELLKGFRLTSVQILSIYVAMKSTSAGQSMVQEVATGSGKSAIIAIIATFIALQGHLVDIHTTNSLLAQRDSNQWSKMIEIFCLRCAHNAEVRPGTDGHGLMEYVKGPKQCYEEQVDIVYGNARQFQFDALRTDYLALGTRGSRPYDYIIVDEVDSICIDDAGKLTILGHHIAGMELLQPLYHQIWEAASRLNEELNVMRWFTSDVGTRYITFFGTETVDENRESHYHYGEHEFDKSRRDKLLEEHVDSQPSVLAEYGMYERRSYMKLQMSYYIDGVLNGNTEQALHPCLTPLTIAPPPLPRNLIEISKLQSKNWAEAAVVALSLEQDKHYVIRSSHGDIIPLDPNNGTTLESSNWSNGLQQFLQVKHALKFTPETLITAFMSNSAMLAKYGAQMLGFTGTVDDNYEFFQKTGMNVVRIPELHIDLLQMLLPQDLSGKNNWRREIVRAVKAQVESRRPVLIICQTIRAARNLEQVLLPRLQLGSNVWCYVRSDEEQKDGFEGSPVLRVSPGDVILTTALGARGLDIKTEEVERFGGLHVILTYLPHSKRIQRQALGRTARQGRLGTAQIIFKLTGKTRSFPSHEELRDSMELTTLSLLHNRMQPLQAQKDAQFELFHTIFAASIGDMLKHGTERGRVAQLCSKVVEATLGEHEWAVLDAYQEYWARYFLQFSNDLARHVADKMSNDSSNAPADDPAKHIVEKEVITSFVANSFHGQAETDAAWLRENTDTVLTLPQSCFYPTRYALQFYRDSKHLPFFDNRDEARRYFDMAIKQDSLHAAGAYAGLAYLELMGDKTFYYFPTHKKGYREKACELLEAAVRILTGYIEQYLVLVFGKDGTLYAEDLLRRVEVLQQFTSRLAATLEFVKRALRPVFITETAKGSNLGRTFSVPRKKVKEVLSAFSDTFGRNSSFRLECRGLSWKKDIRDYHEANGAISNLKIQLKSQKRPQIAPVVIMSIDKDDKSKLVTELGHRNDEEHRSILDKLLPLDIKFRLRRSTWESVMKGQEVQDLKWDAVVEVISQDKMINLLKSFEPSRAATCRVGWSVKKKLCNGGGGNGNDPPSESNYCQEIWHQTSASDKRLTAMLKDATEIHLIVEGVKSDALKQLLKTVADTTAINNLSISCHWVQVKRLDDLKRYIHVLRIAEELFIKPSEEPLKTLKTLKELGVNPNVICFESLSFQALRAVLKSLQRSGDDPIVQLGVQPLEKLYAQAPGAGSSKDWSEALKNMKKMGLYLVGQFEELGSTRPKTELVLGIICFSQILAATTLLCTGVGTPFAAVLYSAATTEVWQFFKSHFARNFSWTSYLITKSIGFLLALLGASPAVSELLTTPASTETAALPDLCERVLDLFAGQNVDQMVKKVGLQALKRVVALSSSSLVSSELRQPILDEVSKAVSTGLESVEIRDILSSFYALHRLDHERFYGGKNEDVPEFTATLKDIFTTWLQSSDDKWKKIREALDQAKTKEALELSPELTIGVLVAKAFSLSHKYFDAKKMTERVLSVLANKLKQYLKSQTTVVVLASHCEISEQELDLMGIDGATSPFEARHQAALTDVVRLDKRWKRQAKEAEATLHQLLQFKSNFGTDHLRLFMPALSEFITEKIIMESFDSVEITPKSGTAQGITEVFVQGSAAEKGESPRQSYVIELDDDSPPGVCTVLPQKKPEQPECIPFTLVSVVEKLGRIFPKDLWSPKPCEAAVQLAEVMMYCGKNRVLARLVEYPVEDTKKGADISMSRIYYQLNPSREAILDFSVDYYVSQIHHEKTDLKEGGRNGLARALAIVTTWNQEGYSNISKTIDDLCRENLTLCKLLRWLSQRVLDSQGQAHAN